MRFQAKRLGVLWSLLAVGCMPPSGGGARRDGTDSGQRGELDARAGPPAARDFASSRPPQDQGLRPDVSRPRPPPIRDAAPDSRVCITEACNGRDDDCDGDIDERVPEVGAYCEGSVGACLRPGARVCTGGVLSCVVDDNRVGPEICNGIDDDCDGVSDESPTDVNQNCPVERRGCTLPGTTTCRAGALICIADDPPPAEICNARDDDCDGARDEDIAEVGEPCAVDIEGGRCVGVGQFACRQGSLACEVEVVERPPERCNGRDDDCDGEIDEDAPRVGEACVVGVGQCARSGRSACIEGEFVCDASPGQPRVESCSGRDEDCDGAIDEDDVCVIPDMGPPEPDAAPPPPEFELYGVHNDVSVEVLSRAGFRICYEQQYDGFFEAEQIAERCQGRHIAMACFDINAGEFAWPFDLKVVAMGRRNIVFRRTACDPEAAVTNNGVQWYASPHCSIGFAPEEAELNRARCDRGQGFSNQRVCWGTNWEGGDRCGDAINLDEAANYVRLVFARD